LKEVASTPHSGRLTEAIDAFVHVLVERFKPERVILFGSHARGGADPQSDVDILVLMDFEGQPFEQAFKIRSQITRSFALDLLVRRPADVRRRIEMGDSFLKEILKKGRTLYERAG